MTMMEQEGLFDMAPLPAELRRPIAALRSLHNRGKELLEPVVAKLAKGEDRVRAASARTVYRAREYSPDPTRASDVTVRYTAPSHRKAKEWEGMTHGDIGLIAYAWLDDAGDLKRYVVLRADQLANAILERPQCLKPASRAVLTHHAPGGAEFLVVDLRKIPQDVVADAKGGAEILQWCRHPAPRVRQGDLW